MTLQDARVFVTGGAGFIGSRLVAALARQGARCTVYDNLHPQVHGPNARPPAFPDGTVFVQSDISDAGSLARAVGEAEPDIVYHLAAETGTGQSLDEPARYCHVNVLGTAYLIEAMRACSKPPRRFVLASSRAIYGEGAHETEDGRIVVPPPRSAEAMSAGRFLPELEGEGPLRAKPTREDVPLQPSSIYASTKLMQEHLVLQAGQIDPWRIAVLRFQNVFGPGQSLRNPYTGVLSIFTQILRNGGELNIFEDGQIVRDFVYVDDVVEALVMAGDMDRDAVLANIGSGEPTTILHAAHELARLLGRPTDAAKITGDFRPGDIRYAVADISRARTVLGWTPRTPFSVGLAALVHWAARDAGPLDV